MLVTVLTGLSEQQQNGVIGVTPLPQRGELSQTVRRVEETNRQLPPEHDVRHGHRLQTGGRYLSGLGEQ